MKASAKYRAVLACLSLCLMSAGLAEISSARASETASTTATTSTPAKKSHKKHYSRSKPGQRAPTPDRISEIQSALAGSGYFQGDPNGRWDSNTVAALQKFQSANRIDVTGKLDAITLQKLGLGSDIAGVSAPRPVSPPICCSTAGHDAAPSSGATMTCCSVAASHAQPQAASSAATANPTGATSNPKPQQPSASVTPAASDTSTTSPAQH